ncbi:hypothetical protein DCS_06730 [Drechmeria coniospora]|uniref:Uncharacterized protein n=1 Tax=Drechmeria coniospora TaxID=98403 RepID=A0A151GCE6_DRECN|nr:hypothetical protein DCS_06730 [Drechmeria coniospora]KYK54770.1 hypothetical protein DCS_06730 [Drechmeria coniospora]
MLCSKLACVPTSTLMTDVSVSASKGVPVPRRGADVTSAPAASRTSSAFGFERPGGVPKSRVAAAEIPAPARISRQRSRTARVGARATGTLAASRFLPEGEAESSVGCAFRHAESSVHPSIHPSFLPSRQLRVLTWQQRL